MHLPVHLNIHIITSMKQNVSHRNLPWKLDHSEGQSSFFALERLLSGRGYKICLNSNSKKEPDECEEDFSKLTKFMLKGFEKELEEESRAERKRGWLRNGYLRIESG